MTATVNVKGLKEAQARLTNMAPNTARSTLRKAVRDGGRLLRDAVKASAPRGKTGQLAKSIAEREGSAENKFEARSVVFASRKKSPGGYYAHLVEYGHRTRKTSGTYGQQEFVPARPFMRPAFASNEQKIVDKIGSSLWAGIVAKTR